MASIPLTFESSDLPTWLPTPHVIVMKCEQHGPGPSGFVEYSPDRIESVWIKYGPTVTMGEARTQIFIADIVNSDKGFFFRVPHVFCAFRYEEVGYILMQYIRGHDCSEDDFDMIALAVKQLRSIGSPTTSPGPVGGGPVSHRLFNDHRSSVRYKSVGELQEHVNNVLSLAGYSCSVNFNEEDGGILRLCLDDIHLGNFRKDPSGQLFVLDFGKTNFLPSAFEDLAFADGCGLAQQIGRSLAHSMSRHRGPLRLAAGRLDLLQNNSHGLPYYLRQSSCSRDLSE